MKKTTKKTKLLITTILAGLILSSIGVFAQKLEHKPITDELIGLTKSHPEIKIMLDESLEKAKSINPNMVTNPAQNWELYLDYIDNASELIPQQVLDVPAILIRDKILQSICYFYFLIDQPLTELEDKGYYNNTLQYYPPFSSWLVNFFTIPRNLIGSTKAN